MKKLLATILIMLCVFTFAHADAPDLSGLTYDQLVALQHYITAEIMSRPEWKEITVPAGQWIVGVDIPAGYYSIKPVGGGAYLRIYDDKGHSVTSGGLRKEEHIIGKINLGTAYTVEIEGGSLLFTPAVALGF